MHNRAVGRGLHREAGAGQPVQQPHRRARVGAHAGRAEHRWSGREGHEHRQLVGGVDIEGGARPKVLRKAAACKLAQAHGRHAALGHLRGADNDGATRQRPQHDRAAGPCGERLGAEFYADIAGKARRQFGACRALMSGQPTVFGTRPLAAISPLQRTGARLPNVQRVASVI